MGGLSFPGFGTLANSLLILVGGSLGLMVGKRFPPRVNEILTQAAALVVLFIGVSGMLAAVYQVQGSLVVTRFSMLVIVSFILGAVIGELLRIEQRLENMGAWLEKKMLAISGRQTKLAEGFCFASILFCTGAMAIVGSLNDGLLGDPTMLISKGIIDGATSVVFAATLGPGVLLSAVSVGLYQGLITALSVAAAPLLTETVIAQMSAVGSLIIVAISLKMLFLKELRIGNFLPAIFIPLIWYALTLIFS